jgi:hypothetical protein
LSIGKMRTILFFRRDCFGYEVSPSNLAAQQEVNELQ